jgi:NADH dehydrogenase FAD-containing subunit
LLIVERTKSSRAHKNINSFFKKRGVEVILNDSLQAWRPIGSKFAVETTSGKLLSFSKIIVGFGTRPRNQAFKHDFAENIDEVTGRITVDPFLRLNDKIFVLGDVGSGDRMNNFAANVQGELTAKNLVASIQGKSLTKYSKGPNVILICLGHTMCILVVGDTCIIAGTAPFGTKDSAEAKIMKGTGSMVDIDKKWSKEFAKLTKASVSSSSINS